MNPSLQKTKLEIEQIQKRRQRIKHRAIKKIAFNKMSVDQRLAAKFVLCHSMKGSNGRSMSPELMARHQVAFVNN